MRDYERLKGLKNSQIKSYEAVVDTYSTYISRVVYKVGQGRLSHEDMEEVSADVFIKLWEGRARLEIDPSKLKGYLGVMARNATLNKLRKLASIQVVAVDEDILEDLIIKEDILDYATPEHVLVQKEDAKLLNQVIDALPEPDREIFIRRYFYMEKLIDIARGVGIEMSTVGTKLHRGKQKLEKALRERGVAHE